MKLGGPKLRLAQLNGATANKAEARRFAANTLPLIREAQKAGASSLRAIADILNARGVRTAAAGNGLQLRCGTFCVAPARLRWPNNGPTISAPYRRLKSNANSTTMMA